MQIGGDLRSPRVWRVRDGGIYDFLDEHVATTAQLAERFFTGGTLETRKKKASRWVAKRRRLGRLEIAGIVQRRESGRPEIVYGKKTRDIQLEHDIRITDLANIFKDSVLQRNVKVGDTWADAFMIREGTQC